MKSCSEINEMISAYLENELDEAGRKSFEEHISGCTQCKGEVDGIALVMGLCHDVGEAELPENFTQELHKKLLAVNAEEQKRKRSTSLQKKYIAICSTIAAGLLLTIFLRGAFGGMLINPKYSANSSPAPMEAVAGAQSAQSQNNISRGTSKDKQDGSADTARAPEANFDIKDTGAKDNGANAYAGETEHKTENTPKQDSAGNVPKAASTEGQNAVQDAAAGKGGDTSASGGTNVRMAAMAVVTVKTADMIENIDIRMASDNPEDLLGKVKTLAEESGAQPYAAPDVGISSLTTTSDTTVGQTDSISYSARILITKYEDFLAALKDKLGGNIAELSQVSTRNPDEELKELNLKLDALNKQIEDAKNDINSDSDAINKLENDRTELVKQIETVKQDTGYMIITFHIDKK